MDDSKREELQQAAVEVRKDVVRMLGVARSYGLASTLSVVDILVYLYWARMKGLTPPLPSPASDKLILSKGSAAAALYACLAGRGFLGREELWNYRRLGATLQGCPDIRTPGVDAPGGAHGCGAGVAVGMALAARREGLASHVYCLLGDGELQEGVLWESVFTASAYALSNLTLIIDADGYREAGPLAALKDPALLAGKFTAFGCTVSEADGHDFISLEQAFSAERGTSPLVVIARTNRGSGVPFLEGPQSDMERTLSTDEMERALTLLERGGRA